MQIETCFKRENWMRGWKYRAIFAFLFVGFSIYICYMVSASIKIPAFCVSVYLLSLLFNIKIEGRYKGIVCILIDIFLGIICLFLSNLMANQGVSSLSVFVIFLNIIIYVIVYLLFYIFLLNEKIAHVITIVIFLVMQMISCFIYQFRGSELAAIDFFSIRTAFNVAREYKPVLSITMVYSIVLGMLLIFCFITVLEFAPYRGNHKKIRLISISMIMVQVMILWFGIQKVEPKHFAQSGTMVNGYMLNFCAGISESFVKLPNNYTVESIRKMEREYEQELVVPKKDKYPNIIVVMNESFADLSVLGDGLKTNEMTLEFFDSLSENTIKGYALASVYGGNTPNSEWEFLTGSSLGFLPKTAIPYQQYIKKNVYSQLTVLKEYNYHFISIHPFWESGWMRTQVYPLLGFDECYFIQDFPQENMVRDYVSDQETYEKIIQTYESKKENENLYIFCVTMQNHGGYTGNYQGEILLQGMQQSYPDAEQYLSLVNESDKALKYLIKYFEREEEETVVVFFGDHQPNLNPTFQEEVHGGIFETLDEQELRYKVPFFIWANYDINEYNVECTSINYLSNYMYDVLEIPESPYTEFLKDVQEVIPAVNSQGYYSKEKENFQKIDDATGEEAEWLNKYQILEYNSLFDEKNKSNIFFGDNK